MIEAARWACLLLALLLGATAQLPPAHSWLPCVCTLHEDEAAQQQQRALDVAVRNVIAASSCLQRPADPDALEEAWYDYVTRMHPGDACAESCSVGLLTRPILLSLPWTRILHCSSASGVVDALVAVMHRDFEYATVHSFAHGIYAADRAFARLAPYRIVELQTSGNRGVYVPALALMSTSSMAAGTGAARVAMLGYCAATQALRDAVAGLVGLNSSAAVSSPHTSQWPTLEEDWTGVAYASVEAAAPSVSATGTGTFGLCSAVGPDGFVQVAQGCEFMLCPRGVGFASDHLLTALMHGAIPVYVWAGVAVLPYPAALPWDDIAVTIRADELHLLESTLDSIPASRRVAMRARAAAFRQAYFSREGVLSQVAMWLASADHAALSTVAGFATVPTPVYITATGANASITTTVEGKTRLSLGAAVRLVCVTSPLVVMPYVCASVQSAKIQHMQDLLPATPFATRRCVHKCSLSMTGTLALHPGH